MSDIYTIKKFSSQQVLAEKLASEIAVQLNSAIQKKGSAVIAFSGGSTPKLMLQELAKENVDWSAVTMTLVDERCVDQTHDLSNAKFLHECLLNYLPKESNVTPKFLPLFYPSTSNETELKDKVMENYQALTGSSSTQFDVVILGMGDDGHTASFFPDADNVAELVDGNTPESLLCCESPSTQVPRITWSLPKLLDTSLLVLHITGETKFSVLENAIGGNDQLELPIRSVLMQDQTPLDIYYAA